MRTRCRNIEPDLAAIGPEIPAGGGVSVRTTWMPGFDAGDSERTAYRQVSLFLAHANLTKPEA
jgi:hypothetical protein